MNSPLISTFFVRDIPEKMTEKHQVYAGHLVNQLKQRDELILDFNGLQSSLDPTIAVDLVATTQEDDDNKFNYEEFLISYFQSTDVLSSLQTFKLRGFERASPEFPLLDGMKYLNVLKELDLSGNNLSQLQDDLQLWGLVELKILKLDKTQLNHLPPSIGRLHKLEHLSLSNNKLSSLPVTLEFCQNLKYLNLSKNNFSCLPSTLLHLKNLQDLKRLDNPNLHKRYNGYEQWPHINISEIGKKKTDKNVYNPDSLQALSCRAIMMTNIDYWTEESLPPLHCKMLDKYATQYTYCEKCHQSSSSMFEVKMMMLRFLGLNDVPFTYYSCQNCKDSLKEMLTDTQTAAKQQMDEEYDAAMREAEKAAGFTAEDLKRLETMHRHRNRASRNRRRTRNKKCSIM